MPVLARAFQPRVEQDPQIIKTRRKTRGVDTDFVAIGGQGFGFSRAELLLNHVAVKGPFQADRMQSGLADDLDFLSLIEEQIVGLMAIEGKFRPLRWRAFLAIRHSEIQIHGNDSRRRHQRDEPDE